VRDPPVAARAGIETALIDLGKPWQNGADESFNGTFRDECLTLQWFRNRGDAKVGTEQWRRHDNEVRPPRWRRWARNCPELFSRRQERRYSDFRLTVARRL